MTESSTPRDSARSLSADGRKRPSPLAAFGCLPLVFAPYLLLVVLSLGSGWTFPNLGPDRWDFKPWRAALADSGGLVRSIATSVALSLLVGGASTTLGMIAGRALRRSTSRAVRFIVYLPFVVSPAIAAVGLYDLLVRANLAGRTLGVAVVQTWFATTLATIYFSESWSSKTDRLELLVRNLGGGEWQVWRHAVWPRARGLIGACFIQTALFAWTDYSLASLIGGGQVPTITVRLFAQLREASVNQAAAAAAVLVAPAAIACLWRSPDDEAK